MSSPYVGEIRLFAGNFAPAGWAFCAGQLMPISENETLFNLIGTTYGGDGQSTFALPDLRSRAPLHQGTGSSGTTYQIGQLGGVETVTLTTQQIPSHNHLPNATASGQTLSPRNALAAVPTSTQQGLQLYAPSGTNTALANGSIANAGGSQPHENIQPYLCVSFIMSLFGIYPTPT